jgi:hypothetical protein
VPFVDPQTGKVAQVWYDYLAALDKRKMTELLDISTTAPTNGQVLIYNSTSKLWVPGAN